MHIISAMMSKVPLLLSAAVLISMLASRGEAAKILVFPFGHCINSHLLNVEKLAGMLMDQGHQVTMLVPSTYHGPYSNTDFSRIRLEHFQAPKHQSPICDFNSLQEFLDTPLHKILQAFYKSTYAFCSSLVSQRPLLDRIKSEGYDLAIYDAVDQCSKILAVYIDIPFIVFHTSGYESVLPRHPAYLPTMLTSYTDEMHVGQRVVNSLSYLVQKLIVYFTYSYYQGLKVEHGLNTSINIYHSFDNAALRLILGEYGMDYVGPSQPSYVMVGGFIQPQSHTIPPHVRQFIETSSPEFGVVLVSFGSIARNYGPEWREIFAQAFARLPHRVLWRYNEEAPVALGNNTLLVPWLPQSDILAHPRVTVFVTHCGLNAAYEASYYGKPVVAIPLFADQFFQASKLTKHVKMGQKLDIRKLTPDMLYEAVMDVAHTPAYAQNAEKISYVMQNRPWTQQEQITRWVDYVVQHGGAEHLRSKEHTLEWWEYLLLDVVTIVTSVLLCVGVVCYITCRAVTRTVRRKVSSVVQSLSPQIREEEESLLDNRGEEKKVVPTATAGH